MPSLTLTLIINTYQQPEYLARVLEAVSAQSFAPDQVLVADDGSGEPTREVFQSWNQKQKLPAQHVWQPHEGFRRSRILNQAIARARGQYVVFLDGDTLPHPDFVADHRELCREGVFVQGHRALVKERAAAWFGKQPQGVMCSRRKAFWTGQLEGVKHAFRWPWPQRRFRTDLRGIRGCNLGIWRGDLRRVNGYNEAFVGWGREDSELATRLMNAGVRRLDVRGRAVCFHLWHPPASREGLQTNDQLLAQARDQRSITCTPGLDQYPAVD